MRAYTSAIAALIAVQGFAQTSPRLVNSDSGEILPKGANQLFLDARGFRGEEKNGFASLNLYWGLGSGFGATLKGGFGGTGTFHGDEFDVSHGGIELESQLWYRIGAIPGLSVAAGIAAPSTASRKSLLLTSAVVYRLPLKSIGLYVGLRNVWQSSNELALATFGTEVPLNSFCSVVGDLGLLVAGDNSFSSFDGSLQRTGLYGLGLQLKHSESDTYFVGISNGLGSSTGFGTSPSFGNTAGLVLGLRVKWVQ